MAVYTHADSITGDDSFSFEPAADSADAPRDYRPARVASEQAVQMVPVPDGSAFVVEQSGEKLLTPNGKTYGANRVWFLPRKAAEDCSL